MGNGIYMEVISLERLKMHGVDLLGLGQVASIERVALLFSDLNRLVFVY